MLLRCTSRFLNELGLKKSDIADFAGEINPLDEWYAHIFYIHHSKCVIFMNAKTRFCFVEMDIEKEKLKSLEDLFCKWLSRALYDEDYSAEIINVYTERIKSAEIALTKDRSVTGTMNRFIMDFKYMYEYTRDDRKPPDCAELNLQLRQTPMIKYGFPDKNMKELLRSCAKAQYIAT